MGLAFYQPGTCCCHKLLAQYCCRYQPLQLLLTLSSTTDGPNTTWQFHGIVSATTSCQQNHSYGGHNLVLLQVPLSLVGIIVTPILQFAIDRCVCVKMENICTIFCLQEVFVLFMTQLSNDVTNDTYLDLLWGYLSCYKMLIFKYLPNSKICPVYVTRL